MPNVTFWANVTLNDLKNEYPELKYDFLLFNYQSLLQTIFFLLVTLNVIFLVQFLEYKKRILIFYFQGCQCPNIKSFYIFFL